MSSVRGYLVKFLHHPTKKSITLFEAGHSLAESFDSATKTLTEIMQRENKGIGTADEISKKADDPNVMRRWTVVSVSCVDVEVQ